MEYGRKRRTAYSSGRKELIGYEKPSFRLDGKKTSRKVSRKHKLKSELGHSIGRTPFKFKDWKLA